MDILPKEVHNSRKCKAKRAIYHMLRLKREKAEPSLTLPPDNQPICSFLLALIDTITGMGGIELFMIINRVVHNLKTLSRIANSA